MLNKIILILSLLFVKNSFAHTDEPDTIRLKEGQFVFKSSKGLIVTITSYYRSAEEQATILINKYKKNKSSLNIYRSRQIITEVINIMEDDYDSKKDRIAQVLKEYMDNNRFLSKHMCGQALDIRKNQQGKIFVDFIRKFENLSVIDEGSHYHVRTDFKCNKKYRYREEINNE